MTAHTRLDSCWSYAIAQGMAYLAKMNVMYGDIAAQNVIVGENYVAEI